MTETFFTKESIEKIAKAVIEDIAEQVEQNEENFDQANKRIAEGRERIARKSAEFSERRKKRSDMMNFIRK